MQLARLGFWCAGAAAALFMPCAAMAAEGQACPANSSPEPEVKLGPLKVDRCYESYSQTERTAFQDISNYYGQVLMSVSGGTSMDLDKSFGKALANFFGVKDRFTALVTVAVYAKIADENVLVYEKPVFDITRDNSGKTTLSASILGGSAIAASPTFALDASNTEVSTQIKVALVNNRKLESLGVIKEGVELASKMGGPGSLVTAVGEPAFAAVAARIQSTYEATLSDQETSNLDTVLKFDHDAGVKAVTYRVAFPVAGGAASKIDVKLWLATRQSLLTGELRTDAQGRKWPDASAVPVSRWADRIRLATRSGGIAPTYLSTALDQQGVPQKLEELSLANAAGEQISRQEAVNKSCRALLSALQKGPYRLSEADAQLILYNELERGGVFERYDASTLGCTSLLVPVWKTRYDLAPASHRPKRDIPLQAKVKRLTRMAGSWAQPTPESRLFALSDDFAPRDVHMQAPVGFIQGVVVSEDPPGFQKYPVAVKHLAERKKSCFGNFKPTADTDPTATAFIQFEGDPTLYLATLRFDDRADFLMDPGPRVEGMDLRLASEADRATYNQNGKCL
ncbi:MULTISPECIES: hypothetical protein [unclassified Sphingopyxis]|uniref:hypothetical protein n=1 Tax=unclassified Sphingopyxis TaxID=2614943 RepID=UPI0007317ACC|nr:MULTISPECIES: hypothetical protein [unclassified Sphingopyxis]KTE25542.1 hypothetical protein ATE61_10790 [Sphingopyxis sp. H057]KTE53561.1 hypothetical protein ATE64_06720 [Sphingopyxis sp. H073]KTE56154.1 hypothetical protein ATE69_06705 [Sphingopyxis sp. H071]KTE61847.1 hypothetical protein ATE66_03560 [Sphingopyxis sp. H107]KTE67120.1 hypothetical protein ATE65_03565 [Sphingopyxis sp. H100]